jgi:hypothetical protein
VGIGGPIPARYDALAGAGIETGILAAAAALALPPETVQARPTLCLLPTVEEACGPQAERPPRGRPRKHPKGYDGLGNKTDQTVRKGIYRVTYKTGSIVWRVTVYFQGRNRYMGTYTSELTGEWVCVGGGGGGGGAGSGLLRQLL